MNKVLESKYKEVKGESVAPIEIKNIFNCITLVSVTMTSSYSKLCTNLASYGMIEPIILIENSYGNWELVSSLFSPLDINLNNRNHYRWLAVKGTSKLAFAQIYKYDYIDSIILKNADLNKINSFYNAD
jgi:hypothetical protein